MYYFDTYLLEHHVMQSRIGKPSMRLITGGRESIYTEALRALSDYVCRNDASALSRIIALDARLAQRAEVYNGGIRSRHIPTLRTDQNDAGC